MLRRSDTAHTAPRVDCMSGTVRTKLAIVSASIVLPLATICDDTSVPANHAQQNMIPKEFRLLGGGMLRILCHRKWSSGRTNRC